MLTQAIIISNPTGIHARPAALIVSCAKKFTSIIQLTHGDKVVAIKSVINILSLGLECNDQITLSVDGSDEQEALTTLVDLFASFTQH